MCSLSLHDLALGARKAKTCLRLVPLAAQGSPWLPSLCSSCKVKGGMGQVTLGWKVLLIISKVQDSKIRRTSSEGFPGKSEPGMYLCPHCTQHCVFKKQILELENMEGITLHKTDPSSIPDIAFGLLSPDMRDF